MKRLLFVAIGLLALSAAATERFYIDDFTIKSGETLTVSILLDNETQYSAFQTDIYLPEGLTIEQEDGDYIFDLTARRARDHNIAFQVQADGAIRVMSYSPSVKAYSGNSGALVTFSIIADENFEGPVIIQMKNSLFTTTAGVEVAFADETCTVSTPPVIKGDVNDDGVMDIADVTALIDVLLGASSTFNENNADCNNDGFIDIADVTTLIDALLNGTPLSVIVPKKVHICQLKLAA